jgi:hypothetical protein
MSFCRAVNKLGWPSGMRVWETPERYISGHRGTSAIGLGYERRVSGVIPNSDQAVPSISGAG